MARSSKGWRLRPPKGKRTNYAVAFRLNGAQIERSTGTRDQRLAAREAARIYAREVQDAEHNPRVQRGRQEGVFSELAGQWLSSLEGTYRECTIRNRQRWFVGIERFFESDLDNLTSARLDRYVTAHLKIWAHATVASRLVVLRQWIAWLQLNRYVTWNVTMPVLRKQATGTSWDGWLKGHGRVPAPEVTVAEVHRFLLALPAETKRGGVAVRDRFWLQYETGLRPSTIERLQVPRHWTPGSKTLTITKDIDKTSNARTVRLTAKAIAILERWAPSSGVIFGKKNLDTYVREAARAALAPHKAEVWCGAHLRSARITHLLRAGMKLPAVQRLVGHTNINTTSKYNRLSDEFATSEVERLEAHRRPEPVGQPTTPLGAGTCQAATRPGLRKGRQAAACTMPEGAKLERCA